MIEQLEKPNSLSRTRRRAGFKKYVIKKEKFKYLKSCKIKIGNSLLNFKRSFNTVVQRPRLMFQGVEWENAVKGSFIWLVEALVEGLIANFWTHMLFGVEFSLLMLVAHGFVIKQSKDFVVGFVKGLSGAIRGKDNG